MFIVDEDVLDARFRRPAPQRTLESIHGFRVAFGDGFHRAVIPIRHVAMQALASRGILREIAKAHTLHTPAHDESSSYAHPDILT